MNVNDQLQRLQAGIKAAHEVGNADHVRKLGAEYRRLQSTAQQPTTGPANDGLGDALLAGTDNLGASMGGGVESLGQLLGSESVEGWGRAWREKNEAELDRRNFERPESADGIFKNIREGDAGGALSSLAYGVTEGAPSVIPGIVASGAMVAGAPVAAALATGVGVVQALGETRGEKEDKGLDPQANWQDLGAAVASGVIELVPAGKGAGFTLKFAKEGLQEAAQEGVVIGNTAIQGGEYVPQEVVDRMVDAGIIGGTVSKGADVVVKGAQAVIPDNLGDYFSRTDSAEMTDDELRAADRLVKAADGDMAVLANVNDTDTGSAKAAANAALRGLRAEVSTIASDLRKLAKYQGNRDAETALGALVRTTQAQTSSTPESFQSDVKMAYDALRSSGYTDADVDRLKSVSNQINAIQKFTKGDKGDMGGFSAKTSRFDITDSRSTSSLGGVAIAASGSVATAGTMIAANRAARVVDRMFNNRSRVKRFVDSAKAQQRSVGPIQGETSRDTLSKLRLSDQVAKANLKLQTAAGAAAAKGTQGPRGQSQGSTQVSPEELARRYRVEASNRAPIFESGKAPQNQDPMYAGDRLWEARIGKSGDEVVDALEQLEREGMAPKGAAQMYAEDIGGFTRSMQKNDIIGLQEAVRQRINPEYQPKFDHLDKRGNAIPKPSADQVLKKFKATDKGLTSSRGKQKAIEGDRRYKNLIADIEASADGLDANQLQMVMDLAESINSPAVTRAERFRMVDEILPLVFSKRGQKAVVEVWRKKFTPLAAIGNDYAIEREADPVQAEKEKAFDEKLKKSSKPRKVRTRKAANDNQRPAADRPAETKADKALRKLRKPREDGEGGVSVGPDPKDPKGPEPESPAAETRKAETPTKARQPRKKASLKQEVENRIEDIYYTIELASNEAQTLEEYRATLPSNADGQVEALIYDMGTDRVTLNMLTDAYSELYTVPPQVAARRVNEALNAMEDRGMLKRRMVRNNARLKYDGKFVSDPNDKSQPLMVVDLQFHNPNGTKNDGLDPEFYDRLQIAKAVKQVGKMVPQSGPDVEYGPNSTEDGDFRALKDIPRSRVDNSFRPIFSFLNTMRQTYHSIYPKMLDQVEGALGGVSVDKLGPIGEIMKPKTADGKPDDANVRTLAQLLLQKRESGNTLIRQEWMAGANLRVYSRNGLAHSQAGDIMKGLMRSAEKDKLGGESGLNYVFHGLGNLLGFDKRPPSERRAAIFEDGLVDSLVKFAEDPFGRLRLTDKKGGLTAVGKMVNDSEGFFQALNAAHEVKNMVDWARERHKKKSKLKPAELLQDPEVRADLASNYETDFIVQLDASNNAYQIAGMVMGYPDVLMSTGMLPPEGATGDPDSRQGGDIYMQIAGPAARQIPELVELDLPGSKLRKIFKKPVGTYLYAAEFNSRKKAFEDALSEIAGGNPIFGVEENGLIPVPENIIAEMQTEDGHTFVTPKFDANGDPKNPSIKRKRIVQSGDKFVVETAGPQGKWQSAGTKYATEAEAVRSVYANNFYARMNVELIKQMNMQFPAMQHYLDFAQRVSELVKAEGKETVQVPTKDGMMLEYSFKQNPVFERADVPLGDGNVVPIGIRSEETKMAGRGLAAFMTHQNDAWALRETHKRLQEQGELNTFNPIHDSYGIHPKDAQRTQETWVQTMQELGDPNYNIFLDILNANGLSLNDLDDPKLVKFVMSRQGVAKVDPKQIPTALS